MPGLAGSGSRQISPRKITTTNGIATAIRGTLLSPGNRVSTTEIDRGEKAGDEPKPRNTAKGQLQAR
ncbi:hypothetical protein EZI54_06670 [Marinobacter halodurans]|uniref:Uncharacterized protein n=1 Tax=Marinobacter halodurans TaxID=2528979 RepID=A0ABY1ZN89_9GAMM|nr:hypothetical protein [Marinobacter halodurans]TBW57711.1 hypothetical protein EZI54_06670 [Marinobacter halodurans]